MMQSKVNSGHDLGDDDFGRACWRHEQCSIVPVSRSLTMAADATKRTVSYQQEPENTGRNEPGINQAWVGR